MDSIYRLDTKVEVSQENIYLRKIDTEIPTQRCLKLVVSSGHSSASITTNFMNIDKVTRLETCQQVSIRFRYLIRQTYFKGYYS